MIKNLLKSDFELISYGEKEGKIISVTIMNLITGKIEDLDIDKINYYYTYFKGDKNEQ